MKKRLIGTMLALSMLGTAFAGFTSVVNASENNVKIGVSIWSTSDSLGASCKKILDAAAEALDVELVYVETNLDQDQEIASVENLCASGCDGIIICNSSDGEMATIINTCEANNVKIGQFFRTLSDENVIELAENSTAYAGKVYEDEETTGQNMAQIMADKGLENIGIISQDHGNTTYETRCSGYKERFEELGVNIVAEQWDCDNSEEASNAVNNFIASYPELDGIVVVGGGGEPLEGTISALENNGLTGEIAVCSTDFTTDLGEQLESGAISAMSGGHWTDPLFAFLMVYNAVNGAYDAPVEIIHPMMYVASSEDYADYETYFCGDILPFTAEEIQNLAITSNPDTTLDDLQAAASDLSIEDVKTRHADLF